MEPIYLDTHVLVWLYAGQIERLPGRTRTRINQAALWFSPMAELELQYLHEIGRLLDPAPQVIDVLESRLALSRCDLPFSRVVSRALAVNWTRDPFDRLIVSHAMIRGWHVVTRDASLLANCSLAIW